MTWESQAKFDFRDMFIGTSCGIVRSFMGFWYCDKEIVNTDGSLINTGGAKLKGKNHTEYTTSWNSITVDGTGNGKGSGYGLGKNMIAASDRKKSYDSLYLIRPPEVIDEEELIEAIKRVHV